MSKALEERIAARELQFYLTDSKGTWIADKGKQMRTRAASSLLSGILAVFQGVIMLVVILDMKRDMSTIVMVLFSLVMVAAGVYYGIRGVRGGICQVDRLVLKTAQRTYEWRHGVYPSIQTVQGSLEDFAALQLVREQRTQRDSSNRARRYWAWCLYLRWKDADRTRIGLPFFVMDVSVMEAGRAQELAGTIGQILALPLDTVIDMGEQPAEQSGEQQPA